MVETQNHVMKATLRFFALPNDSVDVVNPLIDNLITLLCAILLTRGGLGSLLEQMVDVLCQHVSDESLDCQTAMFKRISTDFIFYTSCKISMWCLISHKYFLFLIVKN